MKLILTIFLALASFSSFSQEKEDYTLKILNISNSEEAKGITDAIRSMINDSESPFKYFPNFNNSNQQFEFSSETYLTEEIFTEKMAFLGYEVIEFKKESKLNLIRE